MTDTSTADELPPHTNGVASDLDDEERARMRPADIDADVREMERRKRVELIMNSKLFREELERIIETQLKDGTGASGLLQQISDMVGVNKQSGNVFKNSSCVIPINDIRGIESMGYAKGEKILRCKLAAVFRLIDLYGWTQGANTLITARLNQEEEQFLVNPYGMLFHEITASSLIKVDMQGGVLEQGTTNFSVNVTAFTLHAALHAARPDIRCIVHVHTPSVVAISALKHGLLPLSRESVVIGEVSTHPYLGGWLDADEKDKLARNLGPVNKLLLLSNQGALCCGETIEETFFNARNTVLASESQLKLLPLGLDNLVLLNDEARKKIYDGAHRAPESTPRPDQPSILEGKVERKWRVGGIEFEALMRMMDNAGFRTGYIYRHPLVKGEPPKPRNDVEVPPAVSSLGYLLEEEELYRQGLWKKLEGGRKGHDRSRWLNSPNVYQKVEILETGTPDPKKITKWVADGSPSHSTPVKIDVAMQFVPPGTNPKEFKQRQQQIKDYRRADKISAGPQSHILEGVTWEEARKMQDAAVTQTGDQVVLMGAASKGIIQRGHQHNATVYKSPYAKNPFDCVTDEELEDYKKVVEKKAKGEYDTDYSESDGLSSAHINKRMDGLHLRSPTSVTSETEEESRDEPRILRIETRTVPKASQPEVVLSDVETSPVEQFLRAERTSVRSFKNYEDLPFDTINPQQSKSYYRTNSHAGFPRGSYIIPNPVHYHIARHNQLATTMRPTLISLDPTKTASYFKFNNDFRRQPRQVRNDGVITLSLRDAHSVALDISTDTLKAFIYPFAKALNLIEIPISNNQGSQTSYMRNFDRQQLSDEQRNNVEYTPLYVNRYSNTLHTSDQSTSFERQILNDLQQNLVEQFNDISSSNEELNGANSEVNKTVEFTDLDQVVPNESLAEISPELAMALPESSSSKSSSSGKTYNVEKININVEDDFADDELEKNVYPAADYNLGGEDNKGKLDITVGDNLEFIDSLDESESHKNCHTLEVEKENIDRNLHQNLELLCEMDEVGFTVDDNNLKLENVVNQNIEVENNLNEELKQNGDSEGDLNLAKENVTQVTEPSASCEPNPNKIGNGKKHIDIEEARRWALLDEEVLMLMEHLRKLQEALGPEEQDQQDEPVKHDTNATHNKSSAETPSNKPNTSAIPRNRINIEIEDSGLLEFELLGNDQLEIGEDSIRLLMEGGKRADGTTRRGEFQFFLKENGDVLVQLEENSELMLGLKPEDTQAKHNTSFASNQNDSFCEKTTENTDKDKSTLDESIRHSIYDIADKFSTDFLKVVSDYETAVEVINQVKQILNDSQNGRLDSPPRSMDEGIEDPSLTIISETPNSVAGVNVEVDQRVIKLGDVLKNYIFDQGFEVKELLIFPELLNDQNTSKLLSNLISLYKELFEAPLTAEDKNQLRLSIANYVLNLLTLDDRFKNDSNESDNLLNISDKVFTISEYVSEVLDKFFEAIDSEEFSDFSKDMADQSFAQSTPSKRRKLEERPVGVQEANISQDIIDDSVTSFKKDSKVSSDSFWFSISPVPTNPRVVPARRAIINVDDIPLRPPEDLSYGEERAYFTFRGNVDDIPLRPPEDLENDHNNILLSPIREESNINLFGSTLSPDYEILSEMSMSFDYEIVESDTDSNTDAERCISYAQENLVISDSEEEALDFSPEVNIVVCNEIKFVRTNVNNPPFSQRSNVVFTTDVVVKDNTEPGKNTKNDEDKENVPLNTSGDWMGFEDAKF